MKSSKKYYVSFKYKSYDTVPAGWEWAQKDIPVRSYIAALKTSIKLKENRELKAIKIKIVETLTLNNSELDSAAKSLKVSS